MKLPAYMNMAVVAAAKKYGEEAVKLRGQAEAAGVEFWETVYTEYPDLDKTLRLTAVVDQIDATNVIIKLES